MKTNRDDPIDWSQFCTPVTLKDGTRFKGVSPGLTKREWFAGLAMQSICQDRTAIYDVRSIAKGAVEYADALIEELNKEKI